MNLLVDCHSFDSDLRQGMTTYIEGIYRHLPSLAPDITFYFAAKNTDKIKRIFGEATNIRYIPLSSRNRIYRLFFEMTDIIRRYKIDVAHFQYAAPLIKNCRTLITLHDILFVDYPQYFPFSYRLLKQPAFRHSARKADLLLTVSDYSRQRIAERYNIPADRIVITPNAVNTDFADPDAPRLPSMPDRYILYVSRIEPRKNHLAALQAFTRLRLDREGYNLVFVGGETVPTPALHEAVDSLLPEIRRHVILAPNASADELKSWYRHASLFLYPTIAEGFGIPPIEAAVAGVPVVSNNPTAMSDFTFFGDNLIDFNDTDTLDRRILETLHNPAAYDADTIRNQILDRYNWRRIATDLNKALDKFRKDDY